MHKALIALLAGIVLAGLYCYCRETVDPQEAKRRAAIADSILGEEGSITLTTFGKDGWPISERTRVFPEEC